MTPSDSNRHWNDKVARSLVAIAIAPTIALAANAAEPSGPYLGAGIGGTRYDIDYSSQVQSAYQGSSFTVQSAALTRDSDLGYKAFVGYQFVPNFGLELAYVDLGKPKAHFDLDSEHGVFARDATYRIRGVNLAAVGSVPLSDTFSLHGTQWAIRGDWDRFRNIGKTFDLTADGYGRFDNVDLYSLSVVHLFR